MAECTACGHRLPTDPPTACVDEGRDLSSCPYSDANGAGSDAATAATARPSITDERDGGRATAVSTSAGRSGPPDEEPTPGAGESDGRTDDVPPFSVKTAGRSLEPPRSTSGGGATRRDRTGRVGSLLSTVLDALR